MCTTVLVPSVGQTYDTTPPDMRLNLRGMTTPRARVYVKGVAVTGASRKVSSLLMSSRF